MKIDLNKTETNVLMYYDNQLDEWKALCLEVNLIGRSDSNHLEALKDLIDILENKFDIIQKTGIEIKSASASGWERYFKLEPYTFHHFSPPSKMMFRLEAV